ncbi:MAG: acyl-[acyl-carrier-protein]--UDP-N-acetylglucosamine O-acyltransferase, partial [Gammaproteobacteria bacterium]|nr:acyl-[acyl-carrier-protein]--UDP-N-acetylglucosamine O-acyltransferase [Gammaproteobacteria bacterium]
HQFCHIGAHAFLGMFTAINRDVPAYTMVSGQPGTPRGINSEGLKRRGFDAEHIRHIKDAYRTVYRKGMKLADAITELDSRLSSQPELGVFVESLRASERGLVR